MMTPAVNKSDRSGVLRTALEAAIDRGSSMKVEPPQPPQANDGQTKLNTFILPSARDRWMASNLHFYKPKMVENTVRSAMSGNLTAQWLMFDLMEQTWPRLSKNLNELKNAVVDLLNVRDLMPYSTKGQKPSPEAMRRRAIVSSILWDMEPDVAANQNDFDDTVYDLMDAVGKGISILEIDWAMEDAPELQGVALSSKFVFKPKATHWVHPRYYGWPAYGEGLDRLMLNTREIAVTNKTMKFPADWIDLDPDQFLLSIIKQKTGHPLSGSLLRTLGYFWAAQNFTWEWFISFAQIFGNPFRWASYDPSLKALLPTIEAMLQQMGAMGWAAFPEGTKLEFKEATTRGADNPQKIIIDQADTICDILILGQTLTTAQGSRGSQALGRIHKDVRDEKIHALAKRIIKVINQQLIPAICRKNFTDDNECPYLQLPVEQEDSAIERAQRDQIVKNLGMDLPKQWLYERHGIPQPEPGEDIIQGTPAQSDEEVGQVPNLDSATARGRATTSLELLTNRTLENLTQVQARWLGPLKPIFRDLVSAAASGSVTDAQFEKTLTAAAKQFPDLFKRLDTAALQQALEKSMGAAAVNGAVQGILQRRAA